MSWLVPSNGGVQLVPNVLRLRVRSFSAQVLTPPSVRGPKGQSEPLKARESHLMGADQCGDQPPHEQKRLAQVALSFKAVRTSMTAKRPLIRTKKAN